MSTKSKTRSESFPAALERACDGLNFVSETDSDVAPVFGGQPRSASTADILAAIEVSAAAHVEEVKFEKFFSRLTDQKDWFGPEQQKNAKRFASLKRLLEEELAGLKIFRVGKIRLTIYALGLDPGGNVAGVKMIAVET